MQRVKAFTLVEMLAVVAILLVLMGATFGMFSLFAERTGPDTVVATIQAMLNGTRDYAATHGVATRLGFSQKDKTTNTTAMGTILTMEYLPPGKTEWPADGRQIIGHRPILMQPQMFVIRDLPDLHSVTPPAKAVDDNVSDADKKNWAEYQGRILKAVQDLAKKGAISGSIINKEYEFFIEFDSAGYLNVDAATASQLNGLTVARLASGQVTEFVLYPLNTYSGTRLLFD